MVWVVQAAIQEAAWVEQAQMWVAELAAQVEAVAVAQAAAVALVEQAVTLAVQVAAVEAQVARDPLLEEQAEQHLLQKILVAEVEEPRLILHLAVVVEEYSCLFHP